MTSVFLDMRGSAIKKTVALRKGVWGVIKTPLLCANTIHNIYNCFDEWVLYYLLVLWLTRTFSNFLNLATAVAPTRFSLKYQISLHMKKKKLLPKPLQLIIKCALAVFIYVICMFIGQMCTSCTSRSVAQVSMDNYLKSENDKLHSQISAYNALLHQIWIDKPNYFEEALCESDEWLNLDKAVDGDFQGAFTFKSEEDSIAYYNNWHNGDATIRVVRHIIPAHTQEKLDKVFGNGD